MVSTDSGQVALCFGRPVGGVVGRDPRTLVHHVPRPHHLQRVKSVEVDATDRPHIEVRLGVVDGLGKVHVDAPERIDHAGEAVEVQLDIVLHRYSEVLLDRRNELCRTLVEGRIDLVRALHSRVGDEEVAGDGEDGHGPGVGIEVENHDDIAIDAVDSLTTDPVADVLLLQRAPVRGPDEQYVLGPALGAMCLSGRQAFDGNAVHQVVEVPGVAPHPGHDEDDHDPEYAERPCDASPSPRCPWLSSGNALTERTQAFFVGDRNAGGLISVPWSGALPVPGGPTTLHGSSR